MTEFPLVVDHLSDHHSVLDLPVDASPEQIKNQYKLLVRIYHPDRYQDASTRSYAEYKLKRMNQAYTALIKRTGALQVDSRPVVYNSQLDFGVMAEKSTQTVYFQVENHGGLVQDTRLTLSEANSWFQVSPGVSLFPRIAFPMEFAVVADTSKLIAGQCYHGWIDIQINDLTTRLTVAVAVATLPPLPVLPYGYALPIALLLLIVALLFARHAIVRQLNAIQPVAELPAQPKTISLVKSNDLSVDLPSVIAPNDVAPSEITSNDTDKTVGNQAPQLALAESPPVMIPLQQLMPTPTPVAAAAQPAGTARAARKAPPHSVTSVRVIIPGDYNVYARLAPAVTAAAVQLLPAGTQWFAVGRTLDNSWLSILLSDQQTAWVLTEAVQIEAERLTRLPLVATDL